MSRRLGLMKCMVMLRVCIAREEFFYDRSDNIFGTRFRVFIAV
ncbi:hypothetical protein [Borrelia hermsii]|nr:hypothetical protein [Borrelia hermsii]